MKKRLLTLLLTLSMLLSLCPMVAYGANVKTPPPGTNYNTEAQPGSISSAFSKVHVENLGTTPTNKGTAQYLQIIVKPKSLDTPTSVYAVVMRRTDYERIMPNGPAAYGLGGGNYSNLDATLGTTAVKYYGMARKNTVSNNTDPFTMEVVVASGANDGILSQGGSTASIRKSFDKPEVALTETTYVDEYVLIAFGADKTGALRPEDAGNPKDAYYYIDYFYLDSEGYVLTPSYMIRYNGNVNNLMLSNTLDGTYNAQGVPTQTITRGSFNSADLTKHAKPGSTELSKNIPTRAGYVFRGWTDKKDFNFLASNVTDVAAAVTAAGGQFWAAGATFNEPDTLYKVYDLYAVWQQVPVAFNKTGATTVTLGDTEYQAIHYTTKTPQVGVPFDTGNISLAAPNGTSTATQPQPQGWKYFKVTVYERDPKTGATTSFTPTSFPVTGQGTIAGRSATTRYDTLTISPVVVTEGKSSYHYQWKISGTPTKHSDGKEVYMVISVMDGANKTEDTIVYWFDQVKKGAQPVPTLDDNTGLQSRMATTDDGEEGQIFGFYSAGPKHGDDTGYLTNTNGTGTMTQYYENLGMVYEYRPVKVTGEDGQLVDVSYDAGSPYAEMPNDGWREVPFPNSWYTGAHGGATMEQLEPTMALNAKTVKHSNKLGTYSLATLTDETNLSAAFLADGWLNSYGYIEFENGLPIIRGLTKDNVYEVRFRANSSYEVSEAQTLTIGGAAGGGGSSAGLLFNLMRGSVWQIPKTQEQEPQDVTTINVTMGEGGTATITNVQEAASEIDDGGETEPTSVTINANETKTLTVTGQPVTVTVTPDTEHAAHTVTVTADGTALELTDGAYTLPEKTVTGALALNISLTAPEISPEPEAYSAVETETDVTDTLFAASPTGTLPDGSALGLGEGETLQLRDPDNNPVDSITFYVSATGSVLSPGAVDTYVCSVSTTDPQRLVWTKNGETLDPASIDLSTYGFMSLAAQFGGKANPNDFAAVTILEWDRTTVLGTVIVPKGEDATSNLADFVTLNSDTTLDSKGYSADATKPFTNKRGYSFDGVENGVWLNYSSSALTHYGSLVNDTMVDKPTGDDIADISSVTGNMTVVACYGANEFLSTVPGAAGYYTIEATNTERIAGGLFLVTLKVTRAATVDDALVGVQRLGAPALCVQYTYGSSVATIRIDLQNVDEQTVQLAPNTTTDAYAVRVIDAYNYPNWPAAGDKSLNARDSLGGVTSNNLVSGGTWTGTGYTASGYMFNGTVAMFNAAVKPGGTLTDINMTALNELKLDFSKVSAAPGFPNLPVFQAMQAPVVIQKAFNELNGITADTPEKDSYIPLTYEQIQYALASDGALLNI